MAYINPHNPDCTNCNKSGLAILPVRYAVVPKTIATSLPATLGDKVTDVKLQHHKYVLRTLRRGFVYLYHEKHPRGSNFKWEIYSVSTRGTLWKQASTTAINAIDEDPACSRKGHNIPASLIAVEKPEKCGKIWIAFSEHAWSQETFKAFSDNVELRDRRMQNFHPATWIGSKNCRHGLEGTKDNVEKIIEYQDGFAPSSLCGGEVGKISKADGAHSTTQLHQATSCHPMAMRKGQSDGVVEAMKVVGTQPSGKQNAPIILALWDAVGITHELNGFRNDAAGRIDQYYHEREMEISAYNQIEGIKVALEERAGQAARRDAEIGLFRWTPLQSQTRLTNYVKQNPANTAGYARQADLCARWESDAVQKVPHYVATERELYTRLPQPEWKKRMADIDKAVAHASKAKTWDGKAVASAREENAQRKEKFGPNVVSSGT